MSHEPKTKNKAPLEQQPDLDRAGAHRCRGIIYYLRIGLFGIAALTVITILLALLTINSISRDLTDITVEIIPTIEKANHLTELARSLENQARRLPNLYEPFAIGATTYRLRELSKQLNSEVNQLDETMTGVESIEEVNSSIQTMNRKLERLSFLVEKRSEAEKRRRHQVRLINEILSNITAPRTSPADTKSVAREATGFINGLFKAGALLMSSLAANDPADTIAVKKKFLLQLAAIEENLPEVRSTLDERLAGILEDLKSQVAIFDERLDQMRLEIRIGNAIKGLAAINRLVHQIDSISTKLTIEARISAGEANTVIARLRWILSGISVACILGLILTLLFINRRIVHRMRNLQSAMLSHVEGTPAPISTAGTDEISDMARSFMFYVDEVTKRENSLQERSRELSELLKDLKRSEQRFQTMASNIPGAIFQAGITPEGDLDFLYVSAGCEEHFNLSPEALVQGRQRLDIHPEDRERFRETLRQALEQNLDLDFAGKLSPGKKEKKWFRMAAKASREEKGDPTYNGLMLDITMRKLAEQEVFAGERKMSAMSQAIEDGLVIIDDRGKVRFWNQAAENLFGYTSDEAMGLNFFELAVPPEDREKAGAGIKRFARAGEGSVISSRLESVAVNRNGGTFPVEASISSFQVDDQWFAVGTVRDITERKQAEQALKDSEERVKTILDSISTGVIVIDPETRTIVDINPVATQMIGSTRENIIGSTCHRFICPKEMNNCPIIDLGQSIDNEERELLTADGKRIPVIKTATPVTLGGKEYLLESIVDLTERKKIEEALRESQLRLSLLVQSSPLGVIEWDLEFRVAAWNPAAELIFGYTREEAMGRRAQELIVPEDVIPYLDNIWKALLEGKGGIRGANDNITKKGERITCEWYNLALTDETGFTLGAASLVDDVTERKRVEAELKQHLEDLERFNRLVIGREEKMIRLKKEINDLRKQMGGDPRYKVID